MIYFIFLISIMLHESGHLIIAKILKIKIKNLKFNFIGFSAKFDNNISNKKSEKILVLIFGPLVNLFISILFLVNKIDCDYNVEIIYTNLILFVFNILPILPLDGGRILFYIFSFRFNIEKSFEIINCISKVFLAIISVVYAIMIFLIKNIEIFFVIIYLWYLNIKEEVNFTWYIKINKKIRKYLNL